VAQLAVEAAHDVAERLPVGVRGPVVGARRAEMGEGVGRRQSGNRQRHLVERGWRRHLYIVEVEPSRHR
jgi:hypothetical protein